MRVHLHVRRFVCEAAGCPRRINFFERLPGTAATYARRTARVEATRWLLDQALGGAAGEWLAATLGIRIAGSTLLAHVRDAPAPDPQVPRVLGADDSARRCAARLSLHEQMVTPHAAGVPQVQVYDRPLRLVNLGRGTVRTWLRAGQLPERALPRGYATRGRS